MRRVGHLFEQVADFQALCEAARRAARGKRPTRESVDFLLALEPEVLRLERELLDGSYRPRPYRTFRIRDPKPRLISAAAFRDRVVHHALCAALAPHLERVADFDSYACRPGKGTAAALARARTLVRRHPWYLKLDVRHFFETASHAVLEVGLRRLVKDERLLALVRVFTGSGRGLPIGNLTSQHFANFYLAPLDRYVRSELRAPGYLRYMDDLVLFGPDRETTSAWAGAIADFVRRELALEIKHEATRLAPTRVGLPFLGFRLWPSIVRLDGARRRRLFRRMRALSSLDEGGRSAPMQSVVAWTRFAHATRLRQAWLCRHDAGTGT